MTLMYDRCFTEPVRLDFNDGNSREDVLALINRNPKKDREDFRRILRASVVFRIDNVVDYYAKHSRKNADGEFRWDSWNYTRDFPYLAPPYRNMWFEFTPLVHFRTHCKRIGILASALDLNDERTLVDLFLRTKLTPVDALRVRKSVNDKLWQTFCEELAATDIPPPPPDANPRFDFPEPGPEPWEQEWARTVPYVLRRYAENISDISDSTGVSSSAQMLAVLDQYRWAYNLGVFIEFHDGLIVGPGVVGFLLVRDDGSPFALSVTPVAEYGEGLASLDAHPEDTRISLVTYLINPMLLALSFLHCKNVVEMDSTLPEKVARKYAKKHGQPPVTYKTLGVVPFRKVRRSGAERPPEPILTFTAAHSVRGHFKEFRADAPLFGKHTGRFWWQPAVRGTDPERIVVKDYEVKQPQEVEA